MAAGVGQCRAERRKISRLQSPGHIFPVVLDQPQASETRCAFDAIGGEEIARYGDLGHMDGDMARERGRTYFGHKTLLLIQRRKSRRAIGFEETGNV
jgi:hypothetical protein